ncbi:helix-turn-helix transcriptional regulator [Saccharothrix sp. NPDC042600]|uniref:helix-turn-helix domain-containing protein n=1 Tax=Saccharothrix TaxID=2071 RepID=UPI0033FC2989|nr:hypothetical protein GCM10017745_67710 [Saccharothrix mutabilis subsp. capreolus]
MPSHNTDIPLFNPAAMTFHRRRARITQIALAKRMSIHDNKIYRWERGITPISAADLRRVCHELRVVPAQLQHLPDGPPTITDLRSLRAITATDLAHRLALKPHRLAMWEQGYLGPEPGPLLAAIIGISDQAVDDYERTGDLPPALAHRLSRALHITPALAAHAFTASRATVTTTHARAA